MRSGNPKVIELFAGGGGAAVGLHAARYDHLLAVDKWDRAVQTLRAAGVPAIEGMVGSKEVADALAAVVRKIPQIDLLWASPPCQPYSASGLRKGALDPRDGWDATLLSALSVRARVVIIENVQDAPVSAWAEQLKKHWRHAGSFHLVASDFGVPQSRKRSFVYAGPVPCSKFRELVMKRTSAPPRLDKLLPHLRGHYVRLEQTTAVARPTSEDSCPTLTTKRNLYVHIRDVGTRTAGTRIDRSVSRPMTAAEMATIQGFPKGYPFAGSETSAKTMIGNSVPPAMALAIGMAVREILGYPIR